VGVDSSQNKINKVTRKSFVGKVINSLLWRIGSLKEKIIIFNREKYIEIVLGYPGNKGRFTIPHYLLSGWSAGIDLIPHFVKDGRLLEIGCATGDRLLQLRELGWQNISGIELVESAAEIAREKGFKITSGRIEDAIDKVDDSSLDTVVMSMVLEHLENPFEVTRKMAGKLKPGGEFLFSTVVRGSIDYKFFKSYWAGFDFPRHLIFFKRRDLMKMLEANFKEIHFYYQNAPVDFIRSASWRKNGFQDRLIIWMAGSTLFSFIGYLIAFCGYTTRVSVRCTK
jgi:2-polyprenyl-3-methyl-5-hydroxy-6-metoxy-1,4-benzoquinol methylase